MAAAPQVRVGTAGNCEKSPSRLQHPPDNGDRTVELAAVGREGGGLLGRQASSSVMEIQLLTSASTALTSRAPPPSMNQLSAGAIVSFTCAL